MMATISWPEALWTGVAIVGLIIVIWRTLRHAWRARQAVRTIPLDRLPTAKIVDTESLPILAEMARIVAGDLVRRQVERLALLIVFLLVGLYAMTRPTPPGGTQWVATALFLAGEGAIVLNAYLDERNQRRTYRLSARLKGRAEES